MKHEALADAVRRGRLEDVRRLIADGADVNLGESNPPIAWAVIRDGWAQFELPLDAGARRRP